MTWQVLILVFGLLLLWSGAELLIRSSSKLARSFGVSPIIIGLTIISIGTSLPEFVVSLIAAIQNTMGISIGNIIGSNIANIGLILGTAALISNLAVEKSWVRHEVPAMIVFTLLFTVFSKSGYQVGRLEGAVLLALLILVLLYLSRSSLIQMQEFKKNMGENHIQGVTLSTTRRVVYFILSLIGIAGLIVGSKLAVSSGAAIAREIGVSDTVIGLTLIALGTSLPELATTLVGMIRKETEMVVGNIIGSNIFNLLFIGGFVPLVRPIPIENHLFYLEFPFLIGLSLLVWPIMRIRLNVNRIEGILLIALYGIFVFLAFTF
ncbi:MAG: calcium/sodium antiporter [Calditrichia bacterium]